MGELITALLVAVAIVVVVPAPLGMLSRCLPDRLSPNHRTAGLSERLRAEGLDADMQSQYWPAGWPHERPEHRLSTAEAHQAVQRHRDCDAAECPRKRAALRVLVESGRVVLDPRRPF